MARSYGTIENSTWDDPAFRSISDQARLLLTYLRTCKHGNAVGCFVLPAAYIMTDLGWSAETVREGFRQLALKPFALFDQTTNVVFVCDWWRRGGPENQNVVRHACSVVLALPDCRLKERCVNELRDVSRFDIARELLKDYRFVSTQGQLALVLGNRSETVPKGLMPEPQPQPEPEPQPEPPSGEDASASLKSRIFGPGLEWLARTTGKPPARLRSTVGRWCSDHGDDATLQAINVAAKQSPLDPIPYIVRTLANAKTQHRGKTAELHTLPPIKSDADFEATYRFWKRNRYWPPQGYGPDPETNGCPLPPHVRAKVDGEFEKTASV